MRRKKKDIEGGIDRAGKATAKIQEYRLNSGEGSSKNSQEAKNLEKEEKEIKEEYRKNLKYLENNFDNGKIDDWELQNAQDEEYYAYKEKMDAWREKKKAWEKSQED